MWSTRFGNEAIEARRLPDWMHVAADYRGGTVIRIIQGDCRDVLPTLPERSVHCVVTSPPYWGLRSYLPASHADKPREIGQEKRLDCLGWACGENCGQCYICTLRGVFAGVWRVLRDDGTLWINQGDSYHNGDKGGYLTERSSKSAMQQSNLANDIVGAANRQPQLGLKPKDLCAQPWRLALALQADGWYWRDEIIWHKKSCMPSSQRDRCTRSHEVVLMFSKRERYFYDIEAIKEPVSEAMMTQIRQGYNGHDTKDYETAGAQSASETKGRIIANMRPSKKRGDFGGKTADFEGREAFRAVTLTRTKRSVWIMGPEPFKESHFATFPTKLVEPCILAGTSERGVCHGCGAPWAHDVETNNPSKAANVGDDERYNGMTNMGGNHQTIAGLHRNDGGVYSSAKTVGWSPTCKCGLTETVPATVLDPFGGTATVGLVADRLQRNAVLIELNAEYVSMSRKRMSGDSPLFAEVS